MSEQHTLTAPDSLMSVTDDNENSAMQCAQITGAGKPLKITSRPCPETPEEGALIRTLYGGVCHSDLHFIDDQMDIGGGKVVKNRDFLGDAFTGVIPGHEICGVIAELGKEAEEHTNLHVGDTVIVYPWRGCRQCEACSEGHSHLCANNEGGTTDIGQGAFGGGYGSYVIVPEIQLCIKLPHEIPPEIGCMLPCSAATAYNAVTKARPILECAVRVRGVSNLLVVGCGGVGIWVVVILKHFLCNRTIKVICADTNKEKLDTAAALGADDVIEWNQSDDVDLLVNNTTVSGYNKIDAVIDFVGSPKTVEIGFECLNKGGTVVVVGLQGGEYSLSLPTLISKAASIQGVRTAGLEMVKEVIDLFVVQQIQTYPPLEIITLEEINDVLDRLRKGEVKGRAVIKHCDTNL